MFKSKIERGGEKLFRFESLAGAFHAVCRDKAGPKPPRSYPVACGGVIDYIGANRDDS